MNIALNLTRTCGLSLNRTLSRKYTTRDEKIITKTDSKTGISTVLINNHPSNALTRKVLVESVTAVRKLQNDLSVRAVILTSKEGKVFCSGLDIFEIYEKKHAEIAEYWTMVQDWMLAWYGFTKPAVAAINGHALAGGCALALMCDYRIMMDDESKKIGINESQLGIGPVPFLGKLVQSIVGFRKAELCLLRGDVFSPKEALCLNLIDNVADSGDLYGTAEQVTKKLIQVPTPTYCGIKSDLRMDVVKELAQTKEEKADVFASMISHPSIQEALSKYVSQLRKKQKEN